MNEWQEIAYQIGKITGEPFSPNPPRHIGGGCINTTLQLSEGQRHYFIKLNRRELLDMFEAEAEGLRVIAASESIRVPQPICCGSTVTHSYLVLEHIALRGSGSTRHAGRQIAQMHLKTQDHFGWHRSNTIGSTPQHNDLSDNWIQFWRDQRLGFQLNLAANNGFGGKLQQRGELLLELFPVLINHSPRPSLIHGDLWGGNIAYDERGEPVIYDPATYFGDREAELAMTELFGGLGRDFYAAYNEAWPLHEEYPIRKTLYNLYHILNHVNLFGGSYTRQAESMIEHLLAELGH